jgi:hypothetical protein
MGKAPVIPGVDVRTVSYHLGQIFAGGELKEEATIQKIGIVQTEGEREKNIRDWYTEGTVPFVYTVYYQYSDGCADGIWHGELHGTWSTGAALGARW